MNVILQMSIFNIWTAKFTKWTCPPLNMDWPIINFSDIMIETLSCADMQVCMTLFWRPSLPALHGLMVQWMHYNNL